MRDAGCWSRADRGLEGKGLILAVINGQGPLTAGGKVNLHLGSPNKPEPWGSVWRCRKVLEGFIYAQPPT